MATGDQNLTLDQRTYIAIAKQKYAEAQAKGDTAGMLAANTAANAIRAQAGYSGGTDGSKVIPITPTQSTIAAPSSTITGTKTPSTIGSSVNSSLLNNSSNSNTFTASGSIAAPTSSVSNQIPTNTNTTSSISGSKPTNTNTTNTGNINTGVPNTGSQNTSSSVSGSKNAIAGVIPYSAPPQQNLITVNGYTIDKNIFTTYQNNLNQFENDYQAEINRVQNDGDTSNDWQIGLLNSARDKKIAAQQEQIAAQKRAAEEEAARLAAEKAAQEEVTRNSLLGKTLGQAGVNDEFKKTLNDMALEGKPPVATSPTIQDQMMQQLLNQQLEAQKAQAAKDQYWIDERKKMQDFAQNYSAPSNEGLINQMSSAQEAARISALEQSKNASLSGLEGERAGIQPKYYDQRNQTAALSQQKSRNFAEFMANRGGSTSGVNAQAEMSNNAALQGSLGSLGRQEAADYTDIERRKTLVNQNNIDSQNNIRNEVQAQKQQQLLQDAQNRQNAALQIAGLTGVLGGVQTLEAKQFINQLGQQDIQNNANYAGIYNGASTLEKQQIDLQNKNAAQTKLENDYKTTITRFNDNYMQEINNVKNDGDMSNDWQIPLLEAQRQNKIQTQVATEIQTIGQYGEDYLAEINRRSAINPSDPLIPYLKLARIEKLQTQDSAKAKQAQQEFENYIKLEGLNLDKIKTNYDVNKPYYNPKSGSGSGSGSVTASEKDYIDSTFKGATNYIDNTFVKNSNVSNSTKSGNTTTTSSSKDRTIDKDAIAVTIKQYYETGNELDRIVGAKLQSQYGITDDEIQGWMNAAKGGPRGR